jgi:TPR repeat protein
MYSLGWMYANGRGVARDDAYAATLFEMALAKGHVGAEKARSAVGEYTGWCRTACYPVRQTVVCGKG